MRSKNLICSSVLRSLQMLFAIVVLTLSTTLLKNHNDPLALTKKFIRWDEKSETKAPAVLPLAVAVGSLSLVTAVFSLAIAWTNFLREYMEMLIDLVVMIANIVVGIVSIVYGTVKLLH
jgi:ABC-type phosphate transport system permease subunit